MPARAVRIVVLASGRGSPLRAILDAAADMDFGGQVVAAGTDVKGCAAMTHAEADGIPTFVAQLCDFTDRAAWNEALAASIAGHRPDLLVLAGFMRILAPDVVRRFRIVNTHPSLLPSFPGAHPVRDALAAGVECTGVTLHWVDDGIDTGPVIAQLEVPVVPGDDEASLTARIQAAEKPFYINAIRQLCQEIR